MNMANNRTSQCLSGDEVTRQGPKDQKTPSPRSVPIVRMSDVVRSINWDAVIFCDRQRARSNHMTMDMSGEYQGRLVRDFYHALRKRTGHSYSLFWNYEERDQEQPLSHHLAIFITDFPMHRFRRIWSSSGNEAVTDDLVRANLANMVQASGLVTKPSSVMLLETARQQTEDGPRIASYLTKYMNSERDGNYGYYGNYTKQYLSDNYTNQLVQHQEETDGGINF